VPAKTIISAGLAGLLDIIVGPLLYERKINDKIAEERFYCPIPL
jgi:hypothetical protein